MKKTKPKQEKNDSSQPKKQSYTISIGKEDGKWVMTRTNDGFDVLQLMGILDFTSRELQEMISGRVALNIDKVVRQVLADDK